MGEGWHVNKIWWGISEKCRELARSWGNELAGFGVDRMGTI